jgi:hypothetical protein
LGKEPWWEKDFLVDEFGITESEEEQKVRLRKKTEALEKLKEQGWKTEKGERLTLTPESVWRIQQNRKTDKKLTLKTALVNIIELSIVAGATGLGALYGFCAVWGVYFGTKWGALPLYKWILVGFREDKQEDLKKTNESRTVGDCKEA